MKDAERKDLLEVIEDRQGLASTIISTQIPMKNWFETIEDPTMADAILDTNGFVFNWWRCRESNPGHCGYEPHALTI